MATSKKKKACSGCGGFCGGNGRRAGCKFAANEAKRRADEIWAYAKASVAPRSPATHEAEALGDNPLTRCAAGSDGECGHAQCPQMRDGEPRASGRHCPLDDEGDDQ